MPDPIPDHIGHRDRLRQRLIADADGLQDYELIEYLLTLVLPRRDTKKIAKELLREFGGLPGLFAADADALRRVPFVKDHAVAAIRIVQATAARLLRTQVAAKPVLSNWQALLDYLRADLAAAPTERVRVLHLNTRNMLIRDEIMNEGTIDQAPIYAREVIRRAVDLNSVSIILVHNHPSGDPAPSRADIEVTRLIQDAGKKLGIAVHDHIIIGAQGHASLKTLGLM